MEVFKPEQLLNDIDDLKTIKKLPEKYLNEKVILGIDIYKYSRFPLIEQVYVPVLFEKLYRITTNNVTIHIY